MIGVCISAFVTAVDTSHSTRDDSGTKVLAASATECHQEVCASVCLTSCIIQGLLLFLRIVGPKFKNEVG